MRGRGFMPIELAVASFVIGVAVLALAAVLHLGQRAATESDGDTRVALFAADAIATLRLLNDRAATDPDPEAWVKLWAKWDPNSMDPDPEKGWARTLRWANSEPMASEGTIITQFTGFASDVWQADRPDDLPCLDTSLGIHTNFWCPARLVPETADAANSVRADFALRYALGIQAGETTDVGGRVEPRYYAVTLHVWNGLSVSADAGSTFFAVFANEGRLP